MVDQLVCVFNITGREFLHLLPRSISFRHCFVPDHSNDFAPDVLRYEGQSVVLECCSAFLLRIARLPNLEYKRMCFPLQVLLSTRSLIFVTIATRDFKINVPTVLFADWFVILAFTSLS